VPEIAHESVADCPLVIEAGLAVKVVMVGAVAPPPPPPPPPPPGTSTSTVFVSVSDPPLPSLTVNLTVYSPSAVYFFVKSRLFAPVPSPNVQAY